MRELSWSRKQSCPHQEHEREVLTGARAWKVQSTQNCIFMCVPGDQRVWGGGDYQRERMHVYWGGGDMCVHATVCKSHDNVWCAGTAMVTSTGPREQVHAQRAARIMAGMYA